MVSPACGILAEAAERSERIGMRRLAEHMASQEYVS
jgi:hypothetical protein